MDNRYSQLWLNHSSVYSSTESLGKRMVFGRKDKFLYNPKKNPNKITTLQLVMNNDVKTCVVELFPNGSLILNHSGLVTHNIRKWINRILPKEIRVVIRNNQFYIKDEEGNKHLFEKSMVIEQGKVRPLVNV